MSADNLQFKEWIKRGDGVKPRKGQKVTCHVTGYGKGMDMAVPFWSTKDAGQKAFSFKIGLGLVIKGWDEGVIQMGLGDQARIWLSAEYAYG